MRKWLILCLVFIAGCDELIVDPTDPRLPMYTEEGENTAGALINEEAWVSESKGGWGSGNNDILFEVFANQDSLHMIISGYSGEVRASMEFRLSGLGIVQREDLLTLNNRKLTINGQQNAVKLTVENKDRWSSCSLENGVGQLHFRSVKQKEGSVILSGTFGYSAQRQRCGGYEVAYGRFDFGNISFYVIDQ